MNNRQPLDEMIRLYNQAVVTFKSVDSMIRLANAYDFRNQDNDLDMVLRILKDIIEDKDLTNGKSEIEKYRDKKIYVRDTQLLKNIMRTEAYNTKLDAILK